MTRMLACCFVAFVACSDDPTPHDPVTCDQASWGSAITATQQCARACEINPASTAAPCFARCATDPGMLGMMCNPFIYDGITGCCLNSGLTLGGVERFMYFCECQ